MNTQIENNEQTFPRLGNDPAKMKFWGGTKTFASLAIECAKKAEQEEIFKKYKEIEKTKKKVFHNVVTPLPVFNNVRHFVEPEDEPNQQKINPLEEEDGWIKVQNKKRRREKTFEEKVNRPVTPEENETNINNNDNEDYKTCWDERP